MGSFPPFFAVQFKWKQNKDNIFKVESHQRHWFLSVFPYCKSQAAMLVRQVGMGAGKIVERSKTPHWSIPLVKRFSGNSIMSEYERGILKRLRPSQAAMGRGSALCGNLCVQKVRQLKMSLNTQLQGIWGFSPSVAHNFIKGSTNPALNACDFIWLLLQWLSVREYEYAPLQTACAVSALLPWHITLV